MWIIWTLFIVLIVICLALDLGGGNKREDADKAKDAAKKTAVWTILALLFSIVVYWLFFSGSIKNPTGLSPNEAWITYLTGYIIELSLSIDNVFVIAVIFTSFKIPERHQHRVLFFGILGAILFRALMIVFGIELINKFDWVIYVFGVFLLYTAFKMLKGDDETDPHETWIYKQLIKVLPITSKQSGRNFFIKKGTRRYATPLFTALIIIEFTDVMFALDSIPAILAITRDKFIVFSSNTFAILGLRSLFFLIANMLKKFHYIHYSLAAILAFMGCKMLIHNIEALYIPIWLSFLVIICSLACGIIASLLIQRESNP